MTVRDSMRRHPAGKALPSIRARLVRSAARMSLLEALAGLTGVLACTVAAACGVLAPGLDTWLRVALVAPLALSPALLLQGLHGVSDAVRLYGWARHYDHQARELHLAAAPDNNRRRTK